MDTKKEKKMLLSTRLFSFFKISLYRSYEANIFIFIIIEWRIWFFFAYYFSLWNILAFQLIQLNHTVSLEVHIEHIARILKRVDELATFQSQFFIEKTGVFMGTWLQISLYFCDKGNLFIKFEFDFRKLFKTFTLNLGYCTTNFLDFEKKVAHMEVHLSQ